jgi:hypothetical protein
MAFKDKNKFILGVVGAIALGALGSGLWNILLEPLFAWVGRGLINVFTFGISSIRDSFYAEIAKGHHAQATLLILYLIFVSITFALGYFFPRKKPSDEDLKKKRRKILSKVASPDEELSDEELRSRLSLYIHKRTRFIYLIGLLFFSVFLFRYITISYVNKAVTHFEQCYEICLPFFDEKQAVAIKSNFAQINTKKSYIELIEELGRVAEANNVKLPSFKPL